MDQRKAQARYLEADPTFAQRWQALSLNVQSCYERLAQARGAETIREGGVMWTQEHLTITSVEADHINAQLEHALAWYRSRSPLQGAIYWYLTPTPPGDLEARLFARGLKPNWQPHWMWCELDQLQTPASPASPFTIKILEENPAGISLTRLPNGNEYDPTFLGHLYHQQPRCIWHFVAYQGRRPVGHCMLNVTTGARGIGGLFSMGVRSAARNQGIGTALAYAACKHAQDLGCAHVVLNATAMGEPVYRRVGFQSMGYGPSWHLDEQVLAAPAIPEQLVNFLEAVGRGEMASIKQAGPLFAPEVFSEALPSGLTPLEIAVRCRQPESADWLVEHGAPLDLISAWDLGWKERLPALLARNPALVNTQQGEWQLTPLHVAIERNDLELTRLLLTVPNDLTLQDTRFQSTASGWATHFGRTEILSLLQEHHARQP